MQLVAPDEEARCNASGRRTPYTAAQELGINRSSLKRYLDQYPELLGDDGKVDLAQLRAHRADNPNVADAVRKVEQRHATQPKPAETGAGRTHAKSRLDETKAIQADLDLAERLNQVVDPGEIVDAISEAGNYLRERFTAADPILCERLAAESDPRQIKAVLEEEHRKVMTEVQAKFAAAAKLVPEPKTIDQRQSDEAV
jgi:hypothetical protein